MVAVMNERGKWVNSPIELGEPILLQAKLEIPDLPTQLVNRPKLARRLDEGGTGKCIAVIAPAGFGKTVGVVQWLQQQDISAAWVTLDHADNSLTRFWSYLVTALGRISFGNGSIERNSNGNSSISSKDPVTNCQIQTFLQANRVADLEKGLPLLIQQLSTSTAEIFLILDDYHFINEPKIHETLFYFIRYAPHNIHVILLSRTKLPSFLSKSKLGKDYRELGAEELRYSEDEVADYCGLSGLQLSPVQQQALLSRTGGWPMALSFAADNVDQGGFATFEEFFRGDSREIGTYLGEEVYAAWPQEVQEFLLHTSVLDSMTGPLCDTLQDSRDSRNGSASMLSNLVSASPFVTMLNPQKNWYCCAPLLREYLRERLCQAGGSLLPHLHRRAATWYWQNGYINEAVHHFYQAGSHDLVIRLLEQQAPELLSSGRTVSILLEWLDKLPQKQLKRSSMLCLAGAWAKALVGRLTEAEYWLKKAEALWDNDLHLVDAKHQGKGISAGDGAKGNATLPLLQLQQEVSLIRVYLLIRQKNIPPVLNMLEQACRQLQGGSVFREKGLAMHRDEPSVLPGPLGLYGRLQQLASINESMQEELNRIGFPSRYFNLVRAELLYEFNNLEAAVPALMEGLDAAERDRSLDAQVPLFFVLAKLCRAQGQPEEAMQVVAEAERRVRAADELQWQPLLSALKVRLYLYIGELDPARQWLQDDGPGSYDRPTAAQEFAQLTLARVLLANRKYLEAMLLLERQLIFAQQEERLPSTIEILNLQSLACQELGQTGKALTLLEKSLRLGCSEGYVRSFIDEGSLMWALLKKYTREATKQTQHKPDRILSYVRSLLRHMKKDFSSPNLNLSRHELSTTGAGALIDPLTRRELQVLRLLAQDLSNADIAAALSITLNTVKVFNRNIFAKLDVKNRTSAVERARALGIVMIP